jgi:regulator of protease activity HflC (stomatin/prohibitin superfamily)
MAGFGRTISIPGDDSGNSPLGKNKGGLVKKAGYVLGGLMVVALAFGMINVLTSFKGTDPGDICIVKEGGPLDGRSIKEVRQGGEGPKFIGPFNKQHCFPATIRFYTISANAQESDSGEVDKVIVPTQDAVNVNIEGQALFRLNTDPELLKQFYLKYGVRDYNGKKPHEGTEGWKNFLKYQFLPILENSLREAVGGFNCVELNNTCQYVIDADKAVGGEIKTINTRQNMNKAQTEIEKSLKATLSSTLGGEYFENQRFRLRGIKFEDEVQTQITAAQAKRTEVATAKLEAERVVQQAIGRRKVAEQDARAIKIKANSYRKNKAQADIDRLKALCGTNEDGSSKGCGGLQVLGGDVTKLIGGK